MNRVFKDKVCTMVGLIPPGRVMTYGQIAALCSSPGAARVVGQIAHFGLPELPWHRVVNAKGGMASGFIPGGRIAQAKLLKFEGILLINEKVDLQKVLWWP
jgi:methylated-DNA-protein-cysteine methyltransferase related protein